MERQAIAKSKEKSSAGARDIFPSEKLDKEGELEEEEEEEEVDLCHENVRKNMGILARMVGMEGCGEKPAVVLTEVVRVLKELDGQASVACSSSKH